MFEKEQTRSRIEYLIPIDDVLVLLLHSSFGESINLMSRRITGLSVS